MSAKTNIEWCHSTHNEWIGCMKVSTACANCYADEMDRTRFSKTLGDGTPENPVRHWGKGQPRHLTKAASNRQLTGWNRLPFVCPCCGMALAGEGTLCCSEAADAGIKPERHRVFIGSLMDWADEEVPDSWRDRLFDEAEKCTDLRLLFLTKRIEYAAVYLTNRYGSEIPPHFWIGMSWMPERLYAMEYLLSIPAKVRFLSVEPLLGPVDLSPYLWASGDDGGPAPRNEPYQLKLHWIIVGAESGRNRRDCGIEPILSVVRQCQDAGVPLFVKQDCALKPGQQGRIPDDIWKLKELPCY